MSHTRQTKHGIPASSEMLLETLPGAFFVVDDEVTILYANARAQALAGTTREEFLGKSLWRGAPHLVSTTLYQAIQKTKQTREATDVTYLSPV